MNTGNQKTCPIHGTPYQEGSFSDVIHQYIDASSKEELDKITEELVSNRLFELRQWSQGVLSEFTPHFKERFKNINVDSDHWHLEILKWNSMGHILGQLGAHKWSEKIYQALYFLLCDLQPAKGRIIKGLPLHNIGLVDLLRGTPESMKRSQYYMKLAMIEDKLTPDADLKSLPAYNVLKGEHGIPESRLDSHASWVDSYKAKHPKSPCLRPELIYLEYVIDRNNLERSSLYDFDPALVTELMDKVEQAKTPNEKGSALEILMAYLFLTSPGLEVLRNLSSFDGQIDLLVRNLNMTDPILGEFGKYMLVECRNTIDKVDAKAIRDFATKVIQASCSSGIVVAKSGTTGDEEKQAARDARMTMLKIHQRHGVVVFPLTIDQLQPVIKDQVPLLDVLVSEYEKIRFDLS